MARIWSSGFELQSVTSGMEWDTTTNTPTIDTTIKRSGAASLRCNPTAQAHFIRHQFSAGDANARTVYLRFYLYIATATDALDTIALFFDNTSTEARCSIRMNSNRTLEFWDEGAAAQIGSDSSALSLNTWYRIEMSATGDSPNIQAYEAKIDGTTFASTVTPNNVGTNSWPTRFDLGVVTASTCDLYFDDVAVNDDTGSVQNSWPGAGSIVHMQPDGAGDNTTVVSGTYADVDEVTPDDATTIVTMGTPNGLFDVTCESSSSAGIGASDTITLVQVGIREAASSASSESWAVRLKSASGGTTVEGTTTTHNDTTYRTNGDNVPRVYTLTSYTDPTTTTAWTPTGTNSLDNMQIGVKSIDVAPNPLISTLWALVEYVPVAAVTIPSIDTALSLTIDNTTISQNHVIASTDTALALTMDNTTITQNHVITVQDIALSLSEDNTTVDHNHVLPVQDIALALTTDNTTIAQNHVITAQDVALSLTEDNTTIEEENITILPADMALSLTEDNATITQVHIVVSQDIAILLSEDNTTIDQTNFVLTAQDIALALTEDNTTVTETNFNLLVQDIALALTEDNTTLSQNHIVVAQDIALSLSEDNTTVLHIHILSVQDIALSLTEDNTTINQNHIIPVQDIALALGIDATTLAQNHVLAAADIALALSTDNTTIIHIPANIDIFPADIALSLSEDNATLTQLHIIVSQDIALSLRLDNAIIPVLIYAKRYYIDFAGNVYWVLNQEAGLVEKV